MPMVDSPKSDAEYQAEWDAQSLAEAEKIKGDPKRLEKAQTAAARLANEEAEKTSALRKVAGPKKRSQEEFIEMKNLRHRPAKPKISGESKSGSGAGFNVFKKI